MNENAKHGFVPLEALSKLQQRTANLANTGEIAAKPADGSEHFDETGVDIPDASRRRFLSLMAGSMALAGLTGCTRQPAEPIMPYVEQPENVVPGKPKYYATAVPVNGVAEGVIVESHLGRPTKVEGNPDHPASLGATSVLSQACLMDLYDADRMKEITCAWRSSRVGSIRERMDERLSQLFRRARGAGFRILSETVTSPTLGSTDSGCAEEVPRREVASIRSGWTSLGARSRADGLSAGQ